MDTISRVNTIFPWGSLSGALKKVGCHIHLSMTCGLGKEQPANRFCSSRLRTCQLGNSFSATLVYDSRFHSCMIPRWAPLWAPLWARVSAASWWAPLSAPLSAQWAPVLVSRSSVPLSVPSLRNSRPSPNRSFESFGRSNRMSPHTDSTPSGHNLTQRICVYLTLRMASTVLLPVATQHAVVIIRWPRANSAMFTQARRRGDRLTNDWHWPESNMLVHVPLVVGAAPAGRMRRARTRATIGMHASRPLARPRGATPRVDPGCWAATLHLACVGGARSGLRRVADHVSHGNSMPGPWALPVKIGIEKFC